MLVHTCVRHPSVHEPVVVHHAAARWQYSVDRTAEEVGSGAKAQEPAPSVGTRPEASVGTRPEVWEPSLKQVWEPGLVRIRCIRKHESLE